MLKLVRTSQRTEEGMGRVVTPLLFHQTRLTKRIQEVKGLVVVWGLGSGKSLGAIASQYTLGVPATICCPASLCSNMEGQIEKHVRGTRLPIEFISMEMAARSGSVPANPLLIVDEAHRMRDSGSKTYDAISQHRSEKVLLFTGSPFYNHPVDIAVLINLAAGEDIFPTDKDEFEEEYIRDYRIRRGFFQWLSGAPIGTFRGVNRKKVKDLIEIFRTYVDYYPGSKEEFPSVTETSIFVSMSKRQTQIYDGLFAKAPASLRRKVREGLPPAKSETRALNAFLGGARQVANSTRGFIEGIPDEPKIDKVFQEILRVLWEPRSKVMVYSNFITCGINPLKERLDKAHVEYAEFTGEIPQSQRDELVRLYNEDKIRVLLVSAAGGEGLDLKGTRYTFILESNWNASRTAQAIGRGARYRSHSHLPLEERTLQVVYFLSSRAPMGLYEVLGMRKPEPGIDEYVQGLAERKQELIDEFKEIMELSASS